MPLFDRLISALCPSRPALRAAEEQLRIAEAIFQSHEIVLVTDARGLIIRVNAALASGSGKSGTAARTARCSPSG